MEKEDFTNFDSIFANWEWKGYLCIDDLNIIVARIIRSGAVVGTEEVKTKDAGWVRLREWWTVIIPNSITCSMDIYLFKYLSNAKEFLKQKFESEDDYDPAEEERKQKEWWDNHIHTQLTWLGER